MNKRTLRLAGIAYESLVNGPGIRRVFFAQGCNHNCDGCHNPDTHNFCGGEVKFIDDLLDDIKDNCIIRGVTFSGGEPFEQAEGFSYLAKELRKLGINNIWCYTGYTIEKIISNKDNKYWHSLLNSIDVLVDGKFIIDKKTETMKYRGSSNQRVIDVKKTLEYKNICTLDI